METVVYVVLAVFGVALVWGMLKVGWDQEKTRKAQQEYFERENAKARDAEREQGA